MSKEEDKRVNVKYKMDGRQVTGEFKLNVPNRQSQEDEMNHKEKPNLVVGSASSLPDYEEVMENYSEPVKATTVHRAIERESMSLEEPNAVSKFVRKAALVSSDDNFPQKQYRAITPGTIETSYSPTDYRKFKSPAKTNGVNFKPNSKNKQRTSPTSPSQQNVRNLSWAEHIHHDISSFFKYNDNRLVRRGIEVSTSEQRKARTWVFFLIFLQILVCVSYGIIILQVIPRKLLFFLYALAFAVYFILKLGSVGIFVVQNKLTITKPKVKFDEEKGEQKQQDNILVCIPAYNEDKNAFQRTINSVVNSKYSKDKLYMFFIVDGNKSYSFQKLMSVLQGSSYTERVPPNERVLKHGCYEGVRWTVFLKDQNRGKRDSQWLFIEIIRTMIFKPKYIMFVDSDTAFTEDSMLWMTQALKKSHGKVAGVCGKLEISNFVSLKGSASDIIYRISSLVIVGFQVYEYHFNQILGKQAEAAYGSVTCLPGAFSMFKREYLEDVEYEVDKENLETQKLHALSDFGNMDHIPSRSVMYMLRSARVPLTLYDFFSKPSKGIIDRNLYELGEDRTMSIRFLERGLTTLYEPRAVAYTVCPDSLKVLMLQRRRWNNSTFVNLLMMLLKPSLYLQPKTFIVMIFTIFDFIGAYLLPANSVLLMYAIWGPVVTAISSALNFDLSITQLLFWWIMIQLVVIATTNTNTSDMFFAVSSFFGGLMMALALYYFARVVFADAIIQFVDQPGLNWPQVVMILIFPLLHLVVSIPKPPMFLTAAFYYFMLPTISVTIPLYSFFHLDDFTWGNR